ncbi:MAG: acyl-CoA/acyl-ACP dehydrogenase [Cellvibrionales bacterium]|nr:acyl-CoA/acyl-ACP dehydrogenase [Cellvibrionales bacterium]
MFDLDETYKANLDKVIEKHRGNWQHEQTPATYLREFISELQENNLLCRGWTQPFGEDDFNYQYYLHYTLAQQSTGSPGLCVASHVDIASMLLMKNQSNEVQEEYVNNALNGQTILALAMTEPTAGSDLQGIEFTAEERDGQWCLNGSKYGITNLPFADAVIVLARTKKEKSPFSFSLFLVPTDSDGVEIHPALDSMGYEGCLGSMTANNVLLPKEYLLGKLGMGLTTLMKHLDKERLIVCARMLGASEYILSSLITECQSRQTFDDALINHQHINFRVAELNASVLAFRSALELLIHSEHRGKIPTERAAALKYSGAVLVNELSDTYMQLSGGRGYMYGHPAERLYREMPGLALAGGSKEIMLNIVADVVCA